MQRPARTHRRIWQVSWAIWPVRAATDATALEREPVKARPFAWLPAASCRFSSPPRLDLFPSSLSSNRFASRILAGPIFFLHPCDALPGWCDAPARGLFRLGVTVTSASGESYGSLIQGVRDRHACGRRGGSRRMEHRRRRISSSQIRGRFRENSGRRERADRGPVA